MSAESYLRQLSRLRPTRSARRMLGLRRAFRSGEPLRKATARLPGDDLQKQRRRVDRQVQAIRAEFLTQDAAAMQASLAAIDAAAFPDWNAAVADLRLLAPCRDQLLRALQAPDSSPELALAILNVLTAPVERKLLVKQQVEQYLTVKSTYRQLRQGSTKLRREFPAIYRLESVWFDRMRTWPKPTRRAKTPTRLTPQEREWRTAFWVLMSVVVLTLLLELVFGIRS